MTLLATSVIYKDKQTQSESYYPPYSPLEMTPAYLDLITQNTEAFFHLHIEHNLQWLDNTQGCLIVSSAYLLLRSHTPALDRMFQQIKNHDQQQQLAPPPKDPSQQFPALDFDPDYPGTSSGLHDTPSEPTHPSFDPTPLVWSQRLED